MFELLYTVQLFCPNICDHLSMQIADLKCYSFSYSSFDCTVI